jgi:hypothetical protein
MLNTLMRLLLDGLIIIIGDYPIFLTEIISNLMGRIHVHDITKYSIIHRLIENVSSLAIEM